MSAIRWMSWLAATQLLGTPAWAQITQRISVTSSGAQVYGSYSSACISPDGRYVGFIGDATFAPGDSNGTVDGFIRDRQIGTTQIVTLGYMGVAGNNGGSLVSISEDARFVGFWSGSFNLVPGDTNSTWDVFVRDLQLGTTERVSVDSDGIQGNSSSFGPLLSADGRFAVFNSIATNLVPGDTNGTSDAFIRDRQMGTTERLSLGLGGVQANDGSGAGGISSDGRYVVIGSAATNLVSGDTNGHSDVFLVDRQLGTTERVSLATDGGQGNGDSGGGPISADGRFVLFGSEATNLVPGDTNNADDLFLRDRLLGTTERVSIGSGGTQATGDSTGGSISDDGRYVAFWSYAADLVPVDTNLNPDVFVRDRHNGTTERVNVDWAGNQGLNGYGSLMTPDGRFVAFTTDASDLTPEGDFDAESAFLRDRFGGTDFTSTCDPGIGDVAACPCGNPPVSMNRGCENSSATGGASLDASGGAFLSSDSLVFTTAAEKPTATSIVVQGTTYVSNGIVYGQGVRCLAGTTKRLYTKSAVGGSITAPDFGAGDLQVSARSAALGVVIAAGQNRPYLVVYRDPIVLGGCPATSTFNATQTLVVTWGP